MSTVYVPAPLRELLSRKEAVELCDYSGKLLRSFAPAANPEKRKPCEPPLSEEELQRIENGEGDVTTDELFAAATTRRDCPLLPQTAPSLDG